MIRDILVKLERTAARDRVVDYAISVANAFEAHLTGATFARADVPHFFSADIPLDVLQKILGEEEAAGRSAIDRFEKAAAAGALQSADHRMVGESLVGPPQMLATMGRRFDLSIIMQSEPKEGAYNDLLIEAALFDSGRPVIVVPYIQTAMLCLDRVVCCWDGSRAAARAINDALPFLEKAKAVELLMVVQGKSAGGEMHGADIARHLARHDIAVEIAVQPASDMDIPATILSHAADVSADLIVMGAYGHARLREFVLGGVTRSILGSMTAPAFMSH